MSTAARIDELRKKFEENPRRYFAPLANELRKAGDVTQAIALCREFLPKQPGHMSGFIVFGQSLYEAGELEEARTVFEQALSLDPENLIALRHLGDIARASGDAAGARRWYERVLDADPRNDDIAAQLSTLAALRPQTPAHPQPETFESVAARMSETPPIGMDSIGFTVMPTPDSVMRAIDLEGLESRFRDHAPIDLDAVEEAGAAATAETPEAVPEAVAPELDVPEFDVPEVHAADAHTVEAHAVDAPAVEPHAPVDLDVPELSVALHSDDPFAFPEPVQPVEIEPIADVEPTLHDDAEFVEANFEEGLVAENWPDTSELEARVLTPRSVTPASVTPLSSAALDDAIAAFGREREQQAAFDDRANERAEGLEPVAQSFADAYVEPLDAFEATSVDLEAPVSFGETVDNIDVEAPPTFDAITDEIEVPTVDEGARSAFDDTAAFDAVTDELPIPMSFDVVSESIESVAPVEADVDVPVDQTAAALEPADAAHDESIEEVVAEHADPERGSATEPVAELSELPWLAVADSTSELLDASDDGEPGLEEIAGVFADDARSAGDHGAVTVAALEEPQQIGETESFADVAQAIDDEAVSAFADIDDATPTFEVAAQVETSVEAPVEGAFEAENEPVESFSAHAGTPATGSPAFVTETMGELLVAQGFVARAVEVYEELVRRRPYDPVLTSRLEELRAIAAPAVEQHEAAADPVAENEAPATPAASFEMFSPVMSDEFDVSAPTPAYGTPAYGTPVSATPVMGVSAFSGQSYQTPISATPAFTPPRVTPVAPYAQPAALEEFAPRRSAGEWFAALAARRVPRRTPSQSSQAVESSPEGLASLFGESSASQDDAAARALADAFAPLSDRDLESGSVLDFDFARATPAFSPTVATPNAAAPVHVATPGFTPAATPPSAPAAGGNAGFSFDKFFPDPATRRPTPAAPSQNVGSAPVSDDLAQFSAWLKGLGNQ